MKSVTFLEELTWQVHPLADGVYFKPLVSKSDDGIDVSCMLVSVPKGKQVPEHIHEEQVDILYPLKGKAVMWIDGRDSFSLEPGIIVRVPKGTKHKIGEVTEDLLLYDVFWPALI
jgi:quercetin dioxygenase-like cupin family protein